MLTKLTTRFASIATKDDGFTLIELLVVIAISGILAAIAIPAFLGRANAARQAEAKLFLSSLNRAQQAFFVEHNQFSDNLNLLAVNAKFNSNYEYMVEVANEGQPYAIHHANPRIPKVRSYVGMSAIVQDISGTVAIQTLVCESVDVSTKVAATPVVNPDTIECAEGTRPSE